MANSKRKENKNVFFVVAVVAVGGRSAVGSGHSEVNFIAATEESADPFGSAPFDGILGLGLPQLAEAQEHRAP